ncbi:hypothetical protein QAD02_003271 [Eretmocerus hayati]|uniref:Uncharacterized protein n=1 Tax=Eretmocerus hayati TaxID=131215 RepID=A0ACC2NP35_9HYME|nr:hypothetical protein QAD02_003271 [Eretmocerus hayati]
MQRFFLIRCRNEFRIVPESWFESSDGARGTRRYWWPIDASSRDREKLARLRQHPERARLPDSEEILDSAERYDELRARLLLIAADYDTSDDDTMNDHCAQDSDDEFHDSRVAYGAGTGEASDLMLVDGDIWINDEDGFVAAAKSVGSINGGDAAGDGDKDEPMPLAEERCIGLYEEREAPSSSSRSIPHGRGAMDTGYMDELMPVEPMWKSSDNDSGIAISSEDGSDQDDAMLIGRRWINGSQNSSRERKKRRLEDDCPDRAYAEKVTQKTVSALHVNPHPISAKLHMTVCQGSADDAVESDVVGEFYLKVPCTGDDIEDAIEVTVHIMPVSGKL